MKRKLLSTVLAVTMAVSRLTGCGQSGTNEATGTGALESAGLHEDQWRAEQRRQIKAGIPEALGRVYLPLH